jgi:hypothetical protein
VCCAGHGRITQELTLLLCLAPRLVNAAQAPCARSIFYILSCTCNTIYVRILVLFNISLHPSHSPPPPAPATQARCGHCSCVQLELVAAGREVPVGLIVPIAAVLRVVSTRQAVSCCLLPAGLWFVVAEEASCRPALWRSKARSRSSVLYWEQLLPFGAPARLTFRLHCHCHCVGVGFGGAWCHRQWAPLPLCTVAAAAALAVEAAVGAVAIAISHSQWSNVVPETSRQTHPGACGMSHTSHCPFQTGGAFCPCCCSPRCSRCPAYRSVVSPFVCVCVCVQNVLTSLCKGVVPVRGGAPGGSAPYSPACTPSSISCPPRPACIWPFQRGARASLCRCVSCALCENLRAPNRTLHPTVVVALCLQLVVSISRGRCRCSSFLGNLHSILSSASSAHFGTYI